MNEVRATQVAPAVATRTASSEGIEGSNTLPPEGKDLPEMENQPAPAEVPVVEIEKAVTEINEYVQSIQRDLHFSIDEDSGLTVIRVRDKESGELIRQIPEDIFLNLAQKLKENQPIHLFDAHG